MRLKQECAAMNCAGQIEYDIADRYDGMMIQCPRCTCWQEWVAEQERFVVSVGPAEPLDIYGIHGR
jgi:hypothetical protein